MGKKKDVVLNIAHEDFPNIHTMVDALDHRPLNKFWGGGGRERSSRTKDRGSFYESPTWEDAMDKLRNGYDKPLAEIKEEMKKVEKVEKSQSIARAVPRLSIVGHAPCVSRAIMGLPDSMFETHREPMKAKAIAILFDNTAVWDKTPEQLRKSGISVLAICTKLERLGYRVKLDTMPIAVVTGGGYGDSGKDIAYVRMQVKDFRQPFDLHKLCFPFAHSDMLRRVGFAWLETFPHLKSDPGYSYGTVLNRRPELFAKLKEEFSKRKIPEFIITAEDAIGCNFDVNEIMRKVGIADRVRLEE